MSRQNFSREIVVIFFAIAIFALLGCTETEDTSSVLSSETVMGGNTTSFSGRVADESGNPITGLALLIRSREVDDNTGAWTYGPTLKAETDDAGYFSITDIHPGEFQFMLADVYWNGHPFMTEYQLLSVKIGDFTYHSSAQFPPAFGQDTLSITPGRHIENVEVTVRLRARVRAKIVFADGTPLANKEVRMIIKTQDLHGNGTGKIGTTWQTDAQGYFIRYLDTDRTRSYVVSVEYKELSATSEKFVLKVGERREDLILKLSGPPQ